jgi:predicted aspartyl protease
MYGKWTVVLACIITINGTVALDAADKPDVTFRLDPAGAILIPVSVNNQIKTTFMLDTGGSHSIVSANLANRLKLSPVATTQVLTSTGTVTRPVVRLDGISIGTVSANDLMPSVVPADQLRAISPELEGVIGQDVLAGFSYTLDYQKKRLIWNAGEAGSVGSAILPLVWQDGRFLVKFVPGQMSSSPVRLVPDSGAETLVLYERAGSTVISAKSVRGAAGITGLVGNVAGRFVELAELRLGSIALKNQRAAIIDRDPAAAAEGDGLLPLHIFSSVSFNPTAGYFIARPRL